MPGKPTLLLVDDVEEVCEIIAFQLRSAGFQVLTATSGQAALDLLNTHAVGCVITDANMPGMDGFVLLQRIKERSGAKVAVYLMSGYAELSAEELRKQGVRGVFSKPPKMDSMIQTLSALFNLPE